jgi:adenylosuccinate synthase
MVEKIFVVAGLGFGDEGKGSIVDYLVRHYGCKYVLRYNGGSQAAHNVVSSDGLHHCFSQFGSGTLVSGTKTILSKYMLINPISMLVEEEVLREKGIDDAFSRLLVDRECPVITPYNVIINRMLELARGAKRHGSCGQGIGQTIQDIERFGELMIRAGDLLDEKKLKSKLSFQYQVKLDLAEQLVEQYPENQALREQLAIIRSLSLEQIVEKFTYVSSQVSIRPESYFLAIIAEGGIVFEGAQGVLLDKDQGFFPYVTHSQTTFVNAQKLIAESGFSGQVIKLGLLRAYATRHGPGPFVSEATGLNDKIESCHNKKNPWQGEFRVGWFDLVTARYALRLVGKIDGLVITNLDRLNAIDKIKVCSGYNFPGEWLENPHHFFDFNDQESITNIKPYEPVFGNARSRLSEILMQSKPVYVENHWWDGLKSGWNFSYLDFLSCQLNTPIILSSFGVTAQEKSQLVA